MKRLFLLLLASSALAACATTDIVPVAEGDGVETGQAELRGMLEVATPAPPPEPPRQRRGREAPPLQVLAEANTAAKTARGSRESHPRASGQRATPSIRRAMSLLISLARSSSFTPTRTISRPSCWSRAKHSPISPLATPRAGW